MFTDTDTALAPFDVDEDFDNPYITLIPERFLAEDADLDRENAIAEGWAAWSELTFDPDF